MDLARYLPKSDVHPDKAILERILALQLEEDNLVLTQELNNARGRISNMSVEEIRNQVRRSVYADSAVQFLSVYFTHHSNS